MKEKKCLGPVGGQSREKKEKKTDSNGRKFHTHTHGKKNVDQRKKKIARDETTDTQRAPTAAHTNLGNNQFTILTWGQDFCAFATPNFPNGDQLTKRVPLEDGRILMAMMTNHDDGDQQRRWSHDDDDQFTGMFPLEDGRMSMAMIGSLPLLFGMMTRETMDEPPNVTYARVLA